MRLLRETSSPSLRWRLTMDALFVLSVVVLWCFTR